MTINYEEAMGLIDTYNKLNQVGSKQVTISHGEVLNIVVDDLITKYKACLKRNDKRYTQSFKTVLSFYLTEEEIQSYLDEE